MRDVVAVVSRGLFGGWLIQWKEIWEDNSCLQQEEYDAASSESRARSAVNSRWDQTKWIRLGEKVWRVEADV